MRKDIIGNSAYYIIAWSPLYAYEKYDAIKIVPQLPGIMSLSQAVNSKMETLLFYNCWRDGLLAGLKKAMDPIVPHFDRIFRQIPKEGIYYRYTEVDSNYKDIQDILFWLISTYRPRFNDPAFPDSKRYANINVKEINRDGTSVVEKIPGQ